MIYLLGTNFDHCHCRQMTKFHCLIIYFCQYLWEIMIFLNFARGIKIGDNLPWLGIANFPRMYPFVWLKVLLSCCCLCDCLLPVRHRLATYRYLRRAECYEMFGLSLILCICVSLGFPKKLWMDFSEIWEQSLPWCVKRSTKFGGCSSKVASFAPLFVLTHVLWELCRAMGGIHKGCLVFLTQQVFLDICQSWSSCLRAYLSQAR